MPSKLSPIWSSSFRLVLTGAFLSSQLNSSTAPQEEVEPALKIAAAQLPSDPELRWKTEIPILKELKTKARKLGLWNLFLSQAHYPKHGVPLTNLEVSNLPPSRCL